MNSWVSKCSAAARLSALSGAVVLILLANTLRFIGLDRSPPGFHVDELSGAVTVQCLEQEGVDAVGHRYPLFAHLKYGSPKPPTYIYPAILWTRVFGHSIASYRAFSAFLSVLGLIMVFLLARRMLGWETAVWATLVASLSPTVFQISRVALEPGLAPLFVIAGMYCYLSPRRYTGALLSGAMFALAMYSYPPARLFVPAFMVLFLIIRGMMGQRKAGPVVLLGAAFILLNIPLVIGTLSGEYMGRFNKIGIFSEQFLAEQGMDLNVPDLVSIFLRNYAAHLSAEYLFVSGDSNLVYSTGRFGLLGWVEIVGLAFGVIAVLVGTLRVLRKRVSWDQTALLTALMLTGGVVLAIVPAALTWQDIPHSLRMILYWPFLALLTGWSLAEIYRRVPVAGLAVTALAAVFAYAYFNHYFTVYPERSYYMFSAYTKDEVLAAKSKQDWLKFIYRYRRQDFHTRYYLMNYFEGQTCSSSQKVWQEVHKIP